MLLLPYGLVPLALVERLFQRFPCLWIARIFQLPITMYDMVTAPLQFFSNPTEQDWSSSASLTAGLPIFDHLHDILNLPKPALARLGFKLTHYQTAAAIHSNGCINVESRDG